MKYFSIRQPHTERHMRFLHVTQNVVWMSSIVQMDGVFRPHTSVTETTIAETMPMNRTVATPPSHQVCTLASGVMLTSLHYRL